MVCSENLLKIRQTAIGYSENLLKIGQTAIVCSENLLKIGIEVLDKPPLSAQRIF